MTFPPTGQRAQIGIGVPCAHFGNPTGGKTADARMFVHCSLVLREINAVRLVICNEGLNPLDAALALCQGLVRLLRRIPEFLGLQTPDTWKIALD